MQPSILQQDFYAQPALVVARELLGAVLVSRLDCGEVMRARIVQTEAYHQHDRACHAFGGRKTKRNAVLFEAGGVAYVYFVYGMHWMFNVVTGDCGTAEAVLIRAVVPVDGATTIARNRGFTSANPAPAVPERWLDGPAKLAQGLGLSGRHNGLVLDGSAAVWLQVGAPVADDRVRTGPRIGVDYAGADALLPWRFWLA
ncbi:MAG: DNA-3-methyladenine glycosylase [Myxococcales bacterium]|nr:DNA-3-methyladenine glycosylase [Myxococcales bacterium]